MCDSCFVFILKSGQIGHINFKEIGGLIFFLVLAEMAILVIYWSHTGHISIGGQDGEIEGKIRGISGQNRGQIGGRTGEFF